MSLRDFAETAALAATLAIGDANVEQEQRIEAETEQLDVRSLLHEKQLLFWDCTARVRAVLGGRQGGKTFVLAAWLLEAAYENPKTLSLYVALTKESARDIVWPEIKTVADMLGIDSRYLHEHTLTVGPLPNGSVIRCKGSDDRKAIEAYRGIKLKRLAIDELGAQPDFIKYFVDLLWPTMAKHDGQMALAGTPALVLDGYWYDLTKDDRESHKVPVFHWTIFDNPGIPNAVDFVNEYLDSKNATVEDLEPYRPGNERPENYDERLADIAVAYYREWWALWTQDEGTIVFPLRGDRNFVDELPTRTATGVSIDPLDWRYVISVDPGFKDDCAFVVMAGHPKLITRYVVECFVLERAIPSHVGRRLLGLRDQYVVTRPGGEKRLPSVVMDVNGLGKPYAETASTEFGVFCKPAQKTDKASATRFLRSRVISGTHKLLRGKCTPLAQCWSKLPWDAKHLLPQDGNDDESDACIYADREFWPVRSEEVKDDRTDMKREEDRMLAERVRNYKASGSRPAWAKA